LLPYSVGKKSTIRPIADQLLKITAPSHGGGNQELLEEFDI